MFREKIYDKEDASFLGITVWGVTMFLFLILVRLPMWAHNYLFEEYEQELGVKALLFLIWMCFGFWTAARLVRNIKRRKFLLHCREDLIMRKGKEIKVYRREGKTYDSSGNEVY